ncbi:P-loop NTPase [Dermacoccus barathri]|uniref:P-loop NTPase n=1 Tax=Dermacoccus barathri TaxID=322601 RepID=UPI00187AA4CA|nr:SIR2 family protein [Dermacoccus barathri]MBE7372481.1 SIR2 family protein [Dermacoccus barathri]
MNSGTHLPPAVDRLQHEILQGVDTKISFVVGSGLSVGATPSTSEMLQYFCDVLDDNAFEPKKLLHDYSPNEAYQIIAEEVNKRRGPGGIAKAIRKAVLSAYNGPWPEKGSEVQAEEALNSWNISPGQEAFSRLVAAIPAHRRGPIFTTNFDSQIEVSLRRQGIHPHVVATAGRAPISLSGPPEKVTVVHFHGHWSQSTTLHTRDHLAHRRPELERIVTDHLKNTLVVVAGYSGWNDTFTRVLSAELSNGTLAALETELVWLTYEKDSSGDSEVLREISGAPSVVRHFGIDAAEFFSGCVKAVGDRAVAGRTAHPGWPAVPFLTEAFPASEDEVRSFVLGAQPNWGHARALPRLDPTEAAVSAVRSAISRDENDFLVALAGPTGEGKSLGLRQVAMAVATENPAAAVMYRDSNAGTVTPAWVDSLRAQNELTILCIDEADLVLRSLGASLNAHAASDGRIGVILAAHDRYTDALDRLRARRSGPPKIIQLESIAHQDYVKIAAVWESILPASRALGDAHANDLADRLEEESRRGVGTSLFGALLSLYPSGNLASRVRDLMWRLSQRTRNDVKFSEFVLDIAMMQIAWQQEGKGMTLEGLGQIAGTSSFDIIPLVIAPLGREVAISRIGNCVFLRHPALAQAVIDLATEQERRASADRVARAGGSLRLTNKIATKNDPELFHLSRKLKGGEAQAAARGAIKGASSILEPHVSYLSVLRKQGDLEAAERYARAVESSLGNFEDTYDMLRGFWVERSMLSAALQQHGESLEFAIYSLSDMDHARLGERDIGFSLYCATRALRALRTQNAGRYDTAAQAVTAVAALHPGSRRRLQLSVPSPNARDTRRKVLEMARSLRPLLPSPTGQPFAFADLLAILEKTRAREQAVDSR